jgi:hypothetical protein
VREWVQRAMPLIHSATLDLLRGADGLREGLEYEDKASKSGPPSGPASGKPVVRSVKQFRFKLSSPKLKSRIQLRV